MFEIASYWIACSLSLTPNKKDTQKHESDSARRNIPDSSWMRFVWTGSAREINTQWTICNNTWIICTDFSIETFQHEHFKCYIWSSAQVCKCMQRSSMNETYTNQTVFIHTILETWLIGQICMLIMLRKEREREAESEKESG